MRSTRGTRWHSQTASRLKVAKQLVKAKLPRVVELDRGFAVDAGGLTLVLKRVDGRWSIDIDDGVTIGYWRDASDVCHVVIERERSNRKRWRDGAIQTRPACNPSGRPKGKKKKKVELPDDSRFQSS
jgi:hypothetical protein